MIKLAVIGDPIAHSLSPVMQNAGLKAMGIEGDYSAVHVLKENLEDFTAKARIELLGFNITVPHKNNIIKYLDTVSDNAKIAESVNTVTIKGGRLHGESTDGYGLETAVKEAFGIKTQNNAFTFIGCGGAVQAVAFHLAASRVSALYFINRTAETAENLCKRLKSFFPSLETDFCTPDDQTKTSAFLANSKVAIQGTSLGLKTDDPPPINPALLPAGICLYETIYKKTAITKYAEEHGIRYADGRSMLLHQGAKALSIWTGRQAPVEVMRKALYDAIDKRS